LAVEAHRRTRDERLAVAHAGAIHRVAGGEIVGAVQDHAARSDQTIELLVPSALPAGTTFTSGLIRAIPSRPDSTLFFHRCGRMENLALQVGQVDIVAICEHDGPDACRREIERRG